MLTSIGRRHLSKYIAMSILNVRTVLGPFHQRWNQLKNEKGLTTLDHYVHGFITRFNKRGFFKQGYHFIHVYI